MVLVASKARVQVVRVYDAPASGTRVLVDGIWPRGVRKEELGAEWHRAVAPSRQLRAWYGHDPERFDEFARRYREELREPARAAALDELRELGRRRPLTLLTATKDVEISHAAVLADLLNAGS